MHSRVRRAHIKIAVFSIALISLLLTAHDHKAQPRAHTFQESRDPNGLVYEGSTYGGWWYNADHIDANSIVYSFGLGEDTSWDEALLRRGARVFGFDPTPKSLAYIRGRAQLRRGPGRFTLTPQGLWTKDTFLKFTLPDNPGHVSLRAGEIEGQRGFIELKVNTLEHFMEMNGHTRLDILKIDIEGAEYEFLEDLLTRDFFPFDQLLVEFHHRFFTGGMEMHNALIEELFRKGFSIARNEHNQEVTFHRMSHVNNTSRH